MNSTTNFELYKGMVDSINLDKIFGILAEEIFTAIPKDVISEGKRNIIEAATRTIIPMVTKIYKNSFLAVYREEFSDEEFGQLFAYYGPGSTLWSFFNTADFFPWLRKTIKERIQARIEGLDLTSMTTAELQKLSTVNLLEALDQLPEWVKVSSSDYLLSNLCSREAKLGDKIAKKGDEEMAKVNWYDVLEKSGILPLDEED